MAMSEMELLFGDEGWVDEVPAPKRLTSAQFDTVIGELRTRPDRWKVVAIIEHDWFVPLRTGGLLSQLKRAGCETATRRNDSNQTVLYARWCR